MGSRSLMTTNPLYLMFNDYKNAELDISQLFLKSMKHKAPLDSLLAMLKVKEIMKKFSIWLEKQQHHLRDIIDLFSKQNYQKTLYTTKWNAVKHLCLINLGG
jgi:hypothetical protein